VNRLLPAVLVATVFVLLSCNDDPLSVDFPNDGAVSGRVLPAGIDATVTAIQGPIVATDDCDG